tara:strand:+ start:1002 stop:1385 length:384 start_codon:yes stop_codon:yes gene_type:complete
MKFNNECNHPEEDYLFSMDIEGEAHDVWYYRQSLEDKNEFCLRYGNEGHEYRSSWCCAWIERSISHHSKFAYDNEDSAKYRDQFIELKTRLKEAGYWDIEWNLDAEIIELKAAVDNYNDSCRVVVIG